MTLRHYADFASRLKVAYEQFEFVFPSKHYN